VVGTLRNREVLGSNLGSETDNTEGVRGFARHFQANIGTGSQVIPRTLPSISFPLHMAPMILSFDARRT